MSCNNIYIDKYEREDGTEVTSHPRGLPGKGLSFNKSDMPKDFKAKTNTSSASGQKAKIKSINWEKNTFILSSENEIAEGLSIKSDKTWGVGIMYKFPDKETMQNVINIIDHQTSQHIKEE